MNIVRSDEINAAAVGAHPLAVGAVDGHTGDVDAAQEVVGQVGTVVAGHLYLREHGTFFPRFLYSERERADVGAYPEVALAVFGDASHMSNGERCAVLVDEIADYFQLVGSRFVAYQGGKSPVGVDEPEAAARVE